MRALLLVGLAACTSGPPASHLAAYFDAAVYDGQVGVTLSLLDPAGSESTAEGVDRVSASFRDKTVSLPYNASVDPAYSALIPIDTAVAEGEPVTFVLERSGEDPVTASVAAPADFVLAQPAPTPSTQPVTVTWSPTSPDPMHWSADPRCVADVGYDEGPIPKDTGTIVFPPGVLAYTGRTTSCSLMLEIDRMRQTTPRTALLFTSVTFTRGYVTTVQVTP